MLFDFIQIVVSLHSNSTLKRITMRIKELLKEKRITQKELAERMGITPSTLSILLKGNMTMATLRRIADALGVEVATLYDTPEKWFKEINSLSDEEYLKNKLQMQRIENIKNKWGTVEEYEQYKAEEKRILEQQIKIICPHCGKEIKLKLDFDVPNTQR